MLRTTFREIQFWFLEELIAYETSKTESMMDWLVVVLMRHSKSHFAYFTMSARESDMSDIEL